VLFSIITPLYNKEQYFSETAGSVFAQTCPDWEWIIVDDGSTDGSMHLASDCAMQDARVSLLSQVNSGPCSARNRAIANANGEWLLFLDADDLLEPDALAGWRLAIGHVPSVELHAGGWFEVSPDDSTLVATHYPSGHGTEDPFLALLDSAIAFAPWHPSAAIVQRSCVTEFCLWPEAMNRMVTEDTVFWWRLIARSRVSTHDHFPVRYRRGTPGCRDQFADPRRWSQGLFHALDTNISDWLSLRDCLTSGQVANLIRVYESFGLQADTGGETSIANESFRRAEALLGMGIWKSPAATARKLLGIRRFQRLRNILVTQ
jgi:hypothetical protein